MNPSNSFTVNPGLNLLIADLDISTANVLRRANLPPDLFSGSGIALSTNDYYAMWLALEEEANDPALPVRIGKAISSETFDPPIFAAMCSPNLNVAAQRIAAYKKLIGPMQVLVSVSNHKTTLEFVWPDQNTPPPGLALAELVFWVALVRLATRERVDPVTITTIASQTASPVFHEYLGIEPIVGNAHSVGFSSRDAARPFLTVNEPMWQYFEPQLQMRLSELNKESSTTDRVRAALLELLPAGKSSMEDVAYKLMVSPRTLQRRLNEEGVKFQRVRREVREALARHYLSTSSLTAAEISFLLGFEDPNSFYRAFHSWTGQTPELVRIAAT